MKGNALIGVTSRQVTALHMAIHPPIPGDSQAFSVDSDFLSSEQTDRPPMNTDICVHLRLTPLSLSVSGLFFIFLPTRFLPLWIRHFSANRDLESAVAARVIFGILF